jgi:hypothetical protein
MRRASSGAFFCHVQKKIAPFLTQGEDICGATTTTRPKLIVRARHRHSRYVAEATPPSPGASRRATRSTRAIA